MNLHASRTEYCSSHEIDDATDEAVRIRVGFVGQLQRT